MMISVEDFCGLFPVTWWFQGECRLQMEAQRISLSQIHAAQLELLQEETEARTHSLELRLQQQSSQEGPGEEIPRSNRWLMCLRYLSILFSLTIGFVNFKFLIHLSPCFFSPAEPKLLQSINISQAVQKECTEIIEVFLKTDCYVFQLYYCQPPNDVTR